MVWILFLNQPYPDMATSHPSSSTADFPMRKRNGRGWRPFLAWGLALSAFVLAVACHRRSAPAAHATVLDRGAMRNLSRLGQGFLVWERFRDAHWDIWTKELNGENERLLVPHESGCDHFCPKISPDGEMLAYLSYDRGKTPYSRERSTIGRLYLLNLETGKRQMLADEVRSYTQDRAVSWLEERKLCYIDGQGKTVEADLDGGANHRVIREAADRNGYLPSPDLMHAVRGDSEICDIDTEGRLQQRCYLPGSQPFFTSDGKWCFWTQGLGRAVAAMCLPTHEVKTILDKADAQLNLDARHVYFPMVSPCMRLLAFAASTTQHDHARGGYSIYLAPINPKNLQLIGPPVRYTEGAECDRFPDVYCQDLPLGSHYVEGETTIRFSVPAHSVAGRWRFDDGKRAVGRLVRHTFETPGGYWIECETKQGDTAKTFQGFVYVQPADPPIVKAVNRISSRSVAVIFNEEIDIGKATLTLGPDMAISGKQLTPDNRQLLLTSATDLPREAWLLLEGIRDQASIPNVMGRQVFALPHVSASEPGVMFDTRDVRTTGISTILAASTSLEHHGKAYWDEHDRMKFRGGYFDLADPERIGHAFRFAHCLSVEIWAEPQPAAACGAAGCLLSLAGKEGREFVSVEQRGSAMYLRILAADGTMHEAEIGSFTPGVMNHTLLCLDRNGARVFDKAAGKSCVLSAPCDPKHWSPRLLRLGANGEGSKAWRGIVGRLIVSNANITEAESDRYAAQVETESSTVTATYQGTMQLRLVGTSPMPTLEQIQPARDALVRHLYEVITKNTSPQVKPRRIALTQWAWLDGAAMPVQSLKVGDIISVPVEPLEAHPELKALLMIDEATEDREVEQFYDATPWDAGIDRTLALQAPGH